MILGKPLTMNIRRPFLERKPAYTVHEAAALLVMTSRDLRGWIEAGELEGEETRDGLLLSWSELVSFAMDFWDQEEIERALGDDLPMAIPEPVAARRASGAYPAHRDPRARTRGGTRWEERQRSARSRASRLRLRAFRVALLRRRRICRGVGVAGVSHSRIHTSARRLNPTRGSDSPVRRARESDPWTHESDPRARESHSRIGFTRSASQVNASRELVNPIR